MDDKVKECEFCIKGSQYVNGEYLCYAQTNSKKYHKEKFCKDNPNCYFKQNLALKEENEKLQRIRELAMRMHDDWNEFDPINESYIERIENKNKQLQQKNESLIEYAKYLTLEWKSKGYNDELELMTFNDFTDNENDLPSKNLKLQQKLDIAVEALDKIRWYRAMGKDVHRIQRISAQALYDIGEID